MLFYAAEALGQSWKPLDASYGTESREIGSIEVNSRGEIFVGVFRKGVFISRDSNNQWQQITFTGSDNSTSIDDILLDKIGGFFEKSGNGKELNYFDSLYRRTPVFKNYYNYKDCYAINSLDDVYISQLSRVYKTNEKSKFNISTFFVVPDDSDIEYMIVDPSDRVLVFTKTGMYIIDDDGVVNINRNFRLIDRALADNLGNIYVCMKSTGIIRSTDNGKNWDTVHLINPVDSSESFYFNRIKFVDGILYVATTRGLYMSRDKGDTWKYILDIPSRVDVTDFVLLENKEILASEYYSGLYLSKDFGTTWKHLLVNLQINNVRNIITARKDGFVITALVENNLTLFSSNDGNIQFKNSIQDPLSPYINCPIFANSLGDVYVVFKDKSLYLSSHDNNTLMPCLVGLDYLVNTLSVIDFNDIIAGTIGGGIYRSTDGGLSWNRTKPDSMTSTINCFIRNTDNSIYALSDDAVLMKSIDNGYRWTRENCDTSLKNILKLYYFNEYYFALNSSGDLLKSKSFSQNWEKVQIGNKDVEVTDILSTGNRVFLSTKSDGIYASNDNCLSWQKFNDGLQTLRINSLALDSNNVLYAATIDKGILKTILPVVSVKEEVLQDTELKVFPNPTHGMIYLNLKDFSEDYNISIFNVLGEKLNVISKLIGNYLIVDIERFENGLYCIEIRDGKEIRFLKVIKN